MIVKYSSLLILMDMCNNVGSVCILQWTCGSTYICNVKEIFVQGHMPVMWNMSTPVLLVTLLMAWSSYEVYILKKSDIYTELIGICGI